VVLDNRDSQIECNTLLQGFPRTEAQAKALDGMSKPTRAVVVEIDSKTVQNRLAARRWDPVAKQTYNLEV